MKRISVIGPVLNEVDFIGQSIMAAEPYVSEFVYALDEKSDDGTRELLHYIKDKYLHERVHILEHPTFHPSDTVAYNAAFNRCLETMTGDAAFFLHPDMIITEGSELPDGAMAWWTHVTSFAGDLTTVITKGRTDKWKNIHAKKMGLHYFGSYGSQNEDFYHTAVTGKSYRHYGSEFSKYPFPVKFSGIKLNHYCEAKDYDRRLEKMKTCLKTLYPSWHKETIDSMAKKHPRVTLEQTSNMFGEFKFEQSQEPIPDVFSRYGEEFRQFKKEAVLHG